MDPNQDASYRRLLETEWCAKLLNDKTWRIALNNTPFLPPEYGNRFIGKTLYTEDTIRASVCLYKVEAGQVSEMIVLFELGSGLTGLPGMIHGGLIATLLDEASGIFISALIGPDVPYLLKAWDNNECTTLTVDINTATLYLNVTYVKFVKAESVVALRSRLKERRGRKLFVETQVEDGEGNVLAKAEALFLMRRPAL